jgi:uncharacterized Zn finger protein (UPF0148 family)
MRKINKWAGKVNPAVESPAPAAKLDDKGRHCGRKPLIYRRQGIAFCPRCHRDFSLKSGEQQANWAWQEQPDGMFARTELDD